MPLECDKFCRLHILIVDSDRETALRLSTAISAYSVEHQIINAHSGFEGLQQIEQQVVDVVLTADQLIDMTGTTFIRILKSLILSKRKEPACVLMIDDDIDCKPVDIDDTASFDVIRRPVDPDELAFALDRASAWDGLNDKLQSSTRIWRVLLGLIPAAVGIGVLIGLM